jgi:hypothetical protein
MNADKGRKESLAKVKNCYVLTVIKRSGQNEPFIRV